MKKKNFFKFFLISIIIILMIIIYLDYKNKNFNENIPIKLNETKNSEKEYYSNISKNISFITKDLKGNEYIVKALEGEIDIANDQIIFLKNVNAKMKLQNSEDILITSDFGKYNMNNFDTIFSKNVIVTYLDNKITGDNLDYSMKRGSIIISRNIIYTNINNILKADVIEVDTQTKDTKIFMYEKDKKVNVKNFN